MFQALCSALVLVVVLGDLPSGPNPGDKLGEFKVLSFSGPNEGKEFEVLKATKDKPALIIFVNQMTRPALRLLRPIDDYVGKEEKLASHVVWLSEDKEKTEEFLKRAKNSLNLQMPISISLDGKDGPGAYGLNNQVAITILLAKDQKVVANFAFTDPNDTAAPKVLAAIAKLLGKEAPKEEKKQRKKERE